MANNKGVKVTASKSQITTASNSKAGTVNKTRTEALAAANTSNKAGKLMASSKVVRYMARDNMVKDSTTAASNNKVTVSQDMSMLPPPLRIPTFSLTALLLVNKAKAKATADQAAPRKATAAS